MHIDPLAQFETIRIGSLIGFDRDRRNGSLKELIQEVEGDAGKVKMWARNARTVGLAHVILRPTYQHPEGKLPVPITAGRGVVRAWSQRGRTLIEAAASLDFDSPLHIPTDECWESYELWPLEILMTPALTIPYGRYSVVALWADDESLPATVDLPEEGLNIVVSCDGREGSARSVKLPLHWVGLTP